MAFFFCLFAGSGGQRVLGQQPQQPLLPNSVSPAGGRSTFDLSCAEGDDVSCNLICNPDLFSDNCLESVDIFGIGGCGSFSGWGSIGSCDYYTTESTNVSPGAMGIGVYGNGKTEVLTTGVNTDAGKKYLLSYVRKSVNAIIAPNNDDYEWTWSFLTQEMNVMVGNQSNFPNNPLDPLNAIYPSQLPLGTDQQITHDTNFTDTNWQQIVTCFTANANSDALYFSLAPNPSAPILPVGLCYALIDHVELIEDGFPSNQTLYANCNPITIGDNTCDDDLSLFHLNYTWQYSVDNGTNWIAMTETTPIITVLPNAPITLYRITRTMDNTAAQCPVIGSDCVQEEAIYEIHTNTNGCCVINSLYANAPNTPTDNRPAYVVTNSATWSATNNPFVNLYGWTSNTPVALNVDLVIPYGVTLQLRGIQFNFAPQCRVLVQRGGVLIADIGEVSSVTSFTGICNTVWQGIQIEGDSNSHRHTTPSINYGVLQLRGNVFIDDALVAIACQRIPLMPVDILATNLAASPTNFQNINNSVGAELFYTQYFNLGGAYYGGVCQISSHTQIRNSFVGVLLNRYHWNDDLPTCTMQGAAVVATTGLKYPFTALPYTYNTETGVLLNDYWHMCIGPCIADATVLEGNLFAYNKIALRSIASTDNRFFENTVANSRIGVSVNNTAISAFAFDLNVRMNQFQEIERGIQADGSLINIRQNNLFNTATPPTSIGVFLNGCDFDVRENDFTNFTFGNILNQNSTEPSRVFNNIFTNTTTGVWAVGNNGNVTNGGTQIQCNQFNNHQSAAIRVANAIVPPTPGTMDNQGDCAPIFGSGTPADNTFTDTAPTDLHSIINPADFVYYYRTTNPTMFLPASTAAAGFMPIPVVGCITPSNGSNAHCNYITPIPESLVLGLTDTKQKNAKGSELRYQYLDDQQDPTAAKDLFAAMDTRYTQSRLIPYYLSQGDFATAQTLLNNLPNNDEYADLKTLYTLYYNLSSHGKTLWDINPTEETLLRQLANSPSKANFNARAALLMLYGEEYSIQLPAIDGTNEPFNIGFKTNNTQQQKMVSVAPNPANNECTFIYHFANEEPATLQLFDIQGNLLEQHTLIGTGQLRLAVGNLTTGLYYYKVIQQGFAQQTDQLIIVK